MLNIVLDANVALDWCIDSPEGNAYSSELMRLGLVQKAVFFVPLHFDMEVSRILCLKAKAIGTAKATEWRDQALMMLDDLPIQTVAVGLNFQVIGKLSSAYQLDAPDVPYLELARNMTLPLATRDKAMIRAAHAWHVVHWQPTP